MQEFKAITKEAATRRKVHEMLVFGTDAKDARKQAERAIARSNRVVDDFVILIIPAKPR